MKKLKQRAEALIHVPVDKLRSVVVDVVVDAGLRRMQPAEVPVWNRC